MTSTQFPHFDYTAPRSDKFQKCNNHYAMMNRILYFAALLPVNALARDARLSIKVASVQKTDRVCAPKANPKPTRRKTKHQVLIPKFS
jgi:hypothetical protein